MGKKKIVQVLDEMPDIPDPRVEALSLISEALKFDAELYREWGEMFCKAVLDAFGKIGTAPLTKDKVTRTANEAARKFLNQLIGEK